MTLSAIVAGDARACEFAHERLVTSRDCEAVEVWHAGRRLYLEATG